MSLTVTGLHVIATARNVSVLSDLQNLQPKIDIFPLDVTKDDSIQELKASIENATGGRLDILVNNA